MEAVVTRKTNNRRNCAPPHKYRNIEYAPTYTYYAGTHMAERIGSRYYDYDKNGNLTAEREGGHAAAPETYRPYYQDGNVYYTDYGFGLVRPNAAPPDDGAYQRNYRWNERNLLSESSDSAYTVQYRYGVDGQRALKFTANSGRSTAYFNKMWQTSDAAGGWLQSKHIYVNEDRITTKYNSEGNDNTSAEKERTYYYHSDHLGSAQTVTNYRGQVHERLEYTPYGELWIDWQSGLAPEDKTPFRFTGKEMDAETGLYYYGARYLDPKTGRWLSGDPAMGDYFPSAPVNDEARRRNGNLPGMGGVFNYVNLHAYHYAGNNPVKYTDPDGRSPPGNEMLDVKGYFDNLVVRGLSIPGIVIENVVNSVKNFFANVKKGEGQVSFQLSARLAKSVINISLNITSKGITCNIDPNILTQLEAVAKSPVRTNHDKDGNLIGIEFHVPVTDVNGLYELSAILGSNFDLETGDATVIIGAKLSSLGISGETSVQLKLLMKASTIGDNPTVQGGDFINNFTDQASRDRFNQVWTDPF